VISKKEKGYGYFLAKPNTRFISIALLSIFSSNATAHYARRTSAIALKG
jgi:hypothetical protein